MKNLTLRNLTEVCSGIYHGPETALDQEVDIVNGYDVGADYFQRTNIGGCVGC